MINKLTSPVLIFAALAACSGGVEEGDADLTLIADSVLTNGNIYTANADQPWVEAVAIKNGKYRFVGLATGVADYIGDSTTVIDLAGKMAMSGINDAHIHPVRGGIKKLFECNFAFTATPNEVAATVAKCVAENPDAVWIRGGQWDSGFFDAHPMDSPREFLDAVSGGKAVLLNDDSNHNGWVNSKALELAGITKDTPDPVDGTYVRDPATGEANGLLLEGAEEAIFNILPDWSDEQYRQGAAEAIRIANQFGITGLKDANSSELEMAAYYALDQRGSFSVHMATAIETTFGHRTNPLDYDKLDEIRAKYKSEHIHTSHVKLYLDGVPTASRTAAMLAPYTSVSPGHEPFAGMLHIDEDLLTRDLVELDKRGYTVKIHVAGDRAVRVALEAIAAARKANGDRGPQHELAHAGFIDEADVPRFASLRTVADQSPYLWHPSPIINSIVAAVGLPRAERYWPIKALLEANAPVLAGSDWPAAVASMDPWVGIEAMVSRADPREQSPGTFWPEQAISLAQALEIYTINGARALGLEEQTGSVAVGKSADLIVLQHNLFEVPVAAISDTKIIMTLFEGRVVYEQED